ncbi:MAG: transposase [Candidatus Aminicenantes bacterium]|nr:transposase [Candidatus Aminicenantes bacterium]
MARAKRHYIPGLVWHITHRCHKKEFLLKFSKDKRRWLAWLFQAKKRFGLRILDYIVTSNHIHLLVVDDGRRNVIPRSIHLIASRTGQEYNQRKKRTGAFWEDRYHATAVEKGSHLIQCIVYIDMNMVRAGVVNHPAEWPFSGYNEIQDTRQRYSIIDYKRLMNLLHIENIRDLKSFHSKWIIKSIEAENFERESKWTESIAVGSKSFIDYTKEQLGNKARGRETIENAGTCELREGKVSYSDVFAHKNSGLRAKNMYKWDLSH